MATAGFGDATADCRLRWPGCPDSFVSRTLTERPRRLGWPRTPDFQSGNTGSNPVGDTPPVAARDASNHGADGALAGERVEPLAAALLRREDEAAREECP